MGSKDSNLETMESPGRKFRPGDHVWAKCSRRDINMTGIFPAVVRRDADERDICRSGYPRGSIIYMVDVEGRSSMLHDGSFSATEELLTLREPDKAIAQEKVAVMPALVEFMQSPTPAPWQPAQLVHQPEKVKS